MLGTKRVYTNLCLYDKNEQLKDFCMMLEILIITQIAVESLPISSSSHMRLAEMFMLRMGMPPIHLPDFFDHLIHGPTILVLMIFFWREWFEPLRLL